jgi:hypothetical protein
MGGRIYRETMHEPLHRKVFDLVEMRRIVLLDNRNESARTGRVGPADTGVERHDIGALRKREMRNRLMSAPLTG